MALKTPKNKVYIDERLMEKISRGDMDAFRDLYELAYKPLYAFLVSFTQNSEDAQDLLQDTFVQIHKNCHMYVNQGNPMAWIMKIAKNLFLMKYRKDHSKTFQNYDELENLIGFDDISDADNKMTLEKMFEILSSEDRELIILHDLSGLKFNEIASISGKPVGTVLARYNRAIKKLRKEFS